MNINYIKNSNNSLFNDFIKHDVIDNSNCITNYLPIYNKFFNLNNNNYDKINLNQNNSLVKINNIINYNNYDCLIKDNSNNLINKNIFIKFSPIIDVTKYLTGKYNESKLVFPYINNNSCDDKISNYNNSAYTESFFYYLSSLLLNNFSFINGIDFYGSYLAFKKNYKVNVSEDLDDLLCSDYFNDNMNTLYSIDKEFIDLLNYNTRNNKNKICIENINEISYNILSNINELNVFNSVFQDNIISNNNDILELSDNYFKIKDNKIDNSCEQVFSRDHKNTSEEDEDTSEEGEDTHDDGSDVYTSSYSDVDSNISDEIFNININKFPTQIIALEKCKNTLDYLINNSNINDDELSCIILQILLILITYQKAFGFTHNDLHSNNVMYIETDLEYICYKFNNKYYKIKTYGKIFKIIDFGRAIYYYKNRLMCSDSFHKEGDASTQYNFKPYYNSKKKMVKPNYSFDICRLGCSLYDYYIDEVESSKNPSKIKQIICNWCNDDSNKNILYKKNGDERYPDFKLYKMIARTVNKQNPLNILNNNYFNQFICNKYEKCDKLHYVDIDSIPICT